MSGKPGQRRDIETGADRLAVALLIELKRLMPKRLPLEHVAAKLAHAVLSTGSVSLREPRKTRQEQIILQVNAPRGRSCQRVDCWSLAHPAGTPHWNGIGRFVIRGNWGRPQYVEQWTTYTRKRGTSDALD